MDSHVHLLAMASQSAESVAGFRGERLPGVLSQYLEHGITTVRSTGDPLIEILEVRKEPRAGTLPGPRLRAPIDAGQGKLRNMFGQP